MRKYGALLLGLVVALCLFATADAGGDKGKEVTIKGKMTCAKCDFDTVKAADEDLKEKPKGCMTVLIAKKKDKSVVIYFDKASNKKFHGPICREAKDAAVTGTVTKKDGKRTIAATEVKFKE
jgi:hypothetical protein